MVQIKDIKTRIKGITSTQKITKAMKSMSLIRLQRAEARALASRPFIYAITDIVSHLESDNVYFMGNRSKDALFVIFTSDRGLCGAFNENLMRQAKAAINERSKTAVPAGRQGKCKLILVGTKGVMHFNTREYDIYSTYTHLPPVPTASLSNLVMNDCKKLYLEGKVGEVILVYNNFKSKLKYEIKFKRMMPLPKILLSVKQGIRPIFLYEPDSAQLVDKVIEMFLESTVFHSFLDLYASEYSARFAAMSKATDSAQEMIDGLTLELNKTRQAQITNEILEIISGAEALAL
jgi:F-type H+-transporting ATPase subunit gamma